MVPVNLEVKQMSWSYSAHGKPAAVAKNAAARMAKIDCPEPEQTIKNKIADIIAISCAALPQNVVVKIAAAGSQYCPDIQKKGELINSVALTIEPGAGFLE
jgi:hypothetical protein